TGRLAGGAYATRLLRNDGGFSFTNAGAPASENVSNGSVAWGDYDADGDLDLLLSGYNTYSNEDLFYVYRNNGSGSFSVAGGTWGAQAGSAAWGDFDNDGDLDILLTGTKAGVPVARVFRNEGEGAFSDASAGLTGVSYGTAIWGDYDNDRDLDILLVGHGSVDVARLYRNGVTTPNSSPTAPTGLHSAVAGNRVTLGWLGSTDDHTAAASLTYNLQVGTAPGRSDVLPPLADVGTGWRRLPGLGNANHGLSALLELPAGTYHWSVQAVDSAFVGGPFAAARSFTICAPPEAVALEGPTGGMAGEQHVFTATVSPASATTPITYTWEANGVVTMTSGISATASLTWPLPGTYPITVTAANACGVVSATRAITLCQPPELDFTAEPTSGPAPLAVTFSSRITGEVTSHLWQFGDGTTSTGANPVNVYVRPGVYTVTLTVASACGTVSVTRRELISVWVEPLQAVSIEGPATGLVGAAATLTATVAPLTTTTPITYTWQQDGGPIVCRPGS
ncbi:MAG: PKD domain-containing protein, partial [Anaerolineae bacterium]|nr:PKD domain-containing protein [Anaerolineae bacterium]